MKRADRKKIELKLLNLSAQAIEQPEDIEYLAESEVNDEDLTRYNRFGVG